MLTPPARVAISAASTSVRRGLAALLRSSPSFVLVDSEPDAVLVELEEGESLDPRQAGWLLVLCDRAPEPAELARVRGWLPRDREDEDLLVALEAVCRGMTVMLPGASEVRETPESILTTRELEVLRLMAEGLPNKELSARLSISEHTVKFHLSSIFTKLDANSRTEAVTAGIRRGLILI